MRGCAGYLHVESAFSSPIVDANAALSDAPPDQRIRVGRRAGVQRQDQEARQDPRAAAGGHSRGEREDAAADDGLEERDRGLRLGHGAAAAVHGFGCVELALRRRDGIAARAQGCNYK